MWEEGGGGGEGSGVVRRYRMRRRNRQTNFSYLVVKWSANWEITVNS